VFSIYMFIISMTIDADNTADDADVDHDDSYDDDDDDKSER